MIVIASLKIIRFPLIFNIILFFYCILSNNLKSYCPPFLAWIKINIGKIMKLNFAILAGCITIASLSGCKSTEQKLADEKILSNCNLKTFQSYGEMANENPMLIPELSTGYTYWKGSSLLPFGSRDAAVKEATISVCKNGAKFAFVERDKETTYTAQQKLVGGVYHEYYLMPFNYVQIDEDKLVSQLDMWIPSNNAEFSEAHRERLILLAKENTDFLSVTPIIEKYIKSADEFRDSAYTTPLGNKIRYEKHLKLYDMLVDVYVAHNSNTAANMLEKWIKYHPVSTIKYVSYKHLIEIGEMKTVESLLAIESNKNLKKEVGKLLI